MPRDDTFSEPRPDPRPAPAPPPAPPPAPVSVPIRSDAPTSPAGAAAEPPPRPGSVIPLDPSVLETLYTELRAIAAAHMRHERGGHTLQPTALVHEAFIKVADAGGIDWQDRAQVLGTAASAMRRILVDHARRRGGLKRGGAGRDGTRAAARQEPLDPERLAAEPIALEDLIALDEALDDLERHDPRLVRVVELRYFAGLTVDEIADVVGASPRTVDADFRAAKAWLRVALGG